jgi:predicted TIM-barrel fold metal-dependent hydrolase
MSNIVDVWVQWLPPSAPGANPMGEHVFRSYGRLDLLYSGTTTDALLREMDAAAIAQVLLAGSDNDSVAAAVRAHPDRILGNYHVDPMRIMEAVRGLERAVGEWGFKAMRIEPFLWRKPPTDRVYYPLYAKAVELDVAFQTQVGHTGPLYPSETGRPLYIDEVALDFPELRILCGHIGWPWTEEMIAVAWKHANVWIDTSAHSPKHYPAEFVRFLKSFGKTKCCFGSDWPLLGWSRLLPEVDQHLELSTDVRRRFFGDNARRALKLA